MGTLSIGHSLITGGVFTQVNNSHNIQQSPEDRLQAAVTPAAFHNSAERFDPPRCHPNTRVAVMDELVDWAIRRGPFGHTSMLWLSGPAGAGKSAIAQSLCEICFANKFLLAAFFFNRSDPSRNNPKRLVATLAYQIYGIIPQQYQGKILDVIRNDPLIFNRAIEAQLKALIMDPLQDLFERDYFINYDAPRLIVLDGLDECSTGAVQVNLLAALHAMLAQANIPFIVLVASRPEHDIQTYFRSSRLESPVHRLDLSDSYAPDADISLFVRDKLAEIHEGHPFKDRIPQNWPSDEEIEAIVWKSSGQFIYASVVVKYVTSSRHYPPDRLDIVRRLRPATRNLPFANLDAFYSHIFSCVQDISLVRRIICTIMLFGELYRELSVQQIEALCEIRPGECYSALCDLQSVLALPLDPRDNISFLHKSLPDYLQDMGRALEYHIDTGTQAALTVVSRCLQLISADLQYIYGYFVVAHATLLISNIQQFERDIMSFSLVEQWKAIGGALPLDFTLALVNRLHTLRGTEYENLYCHHLQQLRSFAFEYSEVFNDSVIAEYKPDIVVALILSDNLATSVSPAVLDFLHGEENSASTSSFGEPAGTNILDTISNLVNAAALRCIYTLAYDRRAKFVLFALEQLPLLLARSALLPALYDACLPAKFSALSTTDGEILSDPAPKAGRAMAAYRHRYEEDFK